MKITNDGSTYKLFANQERWMKRKNRKHELMLGYWISKMHHQYKNKFKRSNESVTCAGGIAVYNVSRHVKRVEVHRRAERTSRKAIIANKYGG